MSRRISHLKEIESYTNEKISIEKDMYFYMRNMLQGLTRRENDYFTNSIFYFKNECCYLEFHKSNIQPYSVDLWYTQEYVIMPFFLEYSDYPNDMFSSSFRRIVGKYICPSITSFIGDKSIRPVHRKLDAVKSIEDYFRKYDAEMSKRASFLCPENWEDNQDI